MGSAERAKGNRAEQAVARFLREAGFDAVTSRSAQGFAAGADILFRDRTPVAIEVKDRDRVDLPAWWRQATGNAKDGETAAVWHKRRGHSSPGQWWVTVDGATFVRMLRRDG